MSIDPKITFWFGVWTSIMLMVASGAINFDGALPAAYVPMITKWCSILGTINSAVLTALTGYSSNKSGPMASGPASITPTVVKILLAAFVLSVLFLGSPASAQTAPRLTGNIVRDIAASKTTDRSAAALDSIATALAKPFKDIADFIGADADGAVKLATIIPALQDGHGQQCWIAMKSFGDIIQAHPVPITFHVLQDYETLRLLGIATNNLCSNTHCTQVFADLTSMATAASPMPLAIPSLHDLCTKVPQIAVVPAITIPPADPAAPK